MSAPPPMLDDEKSQRGDIIRNPLSTITNIICDVENLLPSAVTHFVAKTGDEPDASSNIADEKIEVNDDEDGSREPKMNRRTSHIEQDDLQPTQDYFYKYIYPKVFSNRKNPSYETLLKLEEARKKVTKKAFHSGFLLLLNWKPTILYSVLLNMEFYIAVAIYVIIRSYVQNQIYTGFVEQLSVPSAGIAAIGSLISILMVYFLNNSFSRYYAIYFLCNNCLGRIFELSFYLRHHTTIDRSKKIWRLVNAAHLLAYVSFSKIHTEVNFFNPINKKHGLMTDFEITTIKESYELKQGGNAYREVLNWALEELIIEAKAIGIPDYRLYVIQQQILLLRNNFAGINNHILMPIPFIYVHYIHVISMLYVPLFSILIACSFAPDDRTEVIGLLVVMLNSTFVLGIRDMCTKLQDPFGLQYVHLNVINFTTVAINGSYNILFRRKPHTLDDYFMQLSADRGSTVT